MPGFALDMMGSGLSAGAANAINGNATPAQTALGTVQGNAFALMTSTVEFTTVAAGTGAILPGTGGRLTNGDLIAVVNQGANALLVYPPVGKQIGLTAVNTAVSLPSGKVGLFLFRGDGNYFGLIGA